MIIYIEKGEGLHAAIRAAGHRIEQVNGVWVSDDDVAVQVFIDTYDPLPDYKDAKIADIKAEGLRRMQLVFPALNSVDEVKLIGELWQSIAPSARNPTANMTRVINTRQAAEAAIATVRGYTTAVQVAAFNPVTSPAWPA